MSNNVNTNLLEDARDLMEELSGTIWERLIERDIEANDLEALRYHVNEAEKEIALEESHD